MVFGTSALLAVTRCTLFSQIIALLYPNGHVLIKNQDFSRWANDNFKFLEDGTFPNRHSHLDAVHFCLLSLSSILTNVGAGFWSWFDQISWHFRSDPVTGGSKRANTPCFYAPPLTHSHAVCLFLKKSAHPLRVLNIDVRRPCFLTVIIAFFRKKCILALAARTPMCAYHIFCQSSFCES